MKRQLALKFYTPIPFLAVLSLQQHAKMTLRAARALAFAAGLLLAVAPLPAAAQAAAPSPSQPRLALLFSANVSTACAGRCSLRAVAAACGSSAAAAGAAGETSAALLRGWNSLSLDGPAAPALTATVTVDCWDPACTVQPRRFVPWRGAQCSSVGSSGAALPALPARPLPGLASGSADLMYTLGGNQAVLVVSYSASQQRAAIAAVVAPNSTASLLPPSNATVALGAPAAAVDRKRAERQECGAGGRHAALLKLALAVWTLGCAVLSARL